MSTEQLNVRLSPGVKTLIPRGDMSGWVEKAIRLLYAQEVKQGRRYPLPGFPVEGHKPNREEVEL